MENHQQYSQVHGQPIGYFVGVTPGDGSYLDWLQNQYGAWLEKLTIRQKFWLMAQLALVLAKVQDKVEGTNPWYQEVPDQEAVQIALDAQKYVKCGDVLRLIQALAEQCTYQKIPG